MGNESYQEVLAAEDLARKLGTQYTRESRTCSKCGAEFLNPVVTERHERNCMGTPALSETEIGYVCRDENCFKAFKTGQGRAAHELSHRLQQCQFCDTVVILTGLGIHEAACDKNPKRQEWLRTRKGSCSHCNKRMLLSSIAYHIEHNCPVAKFKRENGIMEVRSEGPSPEAAGDDLARVIKDKRDEIEASGVAPGLFSPPIVLNMGSSIVQSEVYEVLDLLLPDGFRARYTPEVVEWAQATADLVRKIREER